MKSLSIRKIETGDEEFIEELRGIYEDAFPPEEKRPAEQFIELLAGDEFSQELVIRGDKVAGFFSFWELTDFLYIEHFAIKKSLRGQGAGSAALRGFIRRHTGPIVLEVEPASCGETARRRIGFYERMGFVHNDCDHVQPPYTPGLNPVKLDIMSYPEAVQDYSKVRDALYSTVYDFHIPESTKHGVEKLYTSGPA